MVAEDDDIMIISDDGTIIRMAAADVNVYSRTAQGVRVMRVNEGTKVISLARVPFESEEENSSAEEGETSSEEKASAEAQETPESQEDSQP